MKTPAKGSSGHLHIVRGEGVRVGGRRASLSVIPLKTRSNGEQMVFAYAAPARSSIISAAVHCLAASQISEVVERLRPKQIVDLRLSRSFGRLGFSGQQFLTLLSAKSIEYIPMGCLGNRFAGEGDDELARLRDVVRRDEMKNLLTLRERVDAGPVMLVSAYKEHAGSDREIIVDLLHELRPGFELLLLDEN